MFYYTKRDFSNLSSASASVFNSSLAEHSDVREGASTKALQRFGLRQAALSSPQRCGPSGCLLYTSDAADDM
eukprot:1521745-Alexandrium_andersonii.AAC.1